MTKTDNRKGRAWIRVQLGNNQTDMTTVEIVQSWKSQRRAATHMSRAVQLYEALLHGDTSLLSAYFPGFGATVGAPLPVRKAPNPPPVSLRAARSEAQDLRDAVDGVGFDSLEF